jgi:hypothetical protein
VQKFYFTDAEKVKFTEWLNYKVAELGRGEKMSEIQRSVESNSYTENQLAYYRAAKGAVRYLVACLKRARTMSGLEVERHNPARKPRQ